MTPDQSNHPPVRFLCKLPQRTGILLALRRLHVMHSLAFESKQAWLVQDRLGNLVFASRLLDRRPEITLHRRHRWRCFYCRDCNPSQQQTAPVESI